MRKELEEFLSLKSLSALSSSIIYTCKSRSHHHPLNHYCQVYPKISLYEDNHFDCLMCFVSVLLRFEWRRLDPDPFLIFILNDNSV